MKKPWAVRLDESGSGEGRSRRGLRTNAIRPSEIVRTERLEMVVPTEALDVHLDKVLSSKKEIIDMGSSKDAIDRDLTPERRPGRRLVFVDTSPPLIRGRSLERRVEFERLKPSGKQERPRSKAHGHFVGVSLSVRLDEPTQRWTVSLVSRTSREDVIVAWKTTEEDAFAWAANYGVR